MNILTYFLDSAGYVFIFIVSAGSSDSDSHANNSAFENRGRPLGRSQRLMAAAFSQEPSVGRSRNEAGSASGFGRQHFSHGGSSSEEVEYSRNSGDFEYFVNFVSLYLFCCDFCMEHVKLMWYEMVAVFRGL